jgi:hypothetical protein
MAEPDSTRTSCVRGCTTRCSMVCAERGKTTRKSHRSGAMDADRPGYADKHEHTYGHGDGAALQLGPGGKRQADARDQGSVHKNRGNHQADAKEPKGDRRFLLDGRGQCEQHQSGTDRNQRHQTQSPQPFVPGATYGANAR